MNVQVASKNALLYRYNCFCKAGVGHQYENVKSCISILLFAVLGHIMSFGIVASGDEVWLSTSS